LSQVISRKDVEKATTLIGRMARYLGVNPDFNLIAGKGFFEFKQYDQASEYLGKISKKTAQYPEAQFYLARIDYRQTRFQEGYARLSTLNPPQFSATAIYPQLLDLWMEFYQKVATSSLTVTDFVSAHGISQEALPNVFLSKLGVEAYHYGKHDIAFDYFFKWAPTTPLDHAKRFYFLHRTEVGLNKTPLSGYDERCFYDYPDTIYASFLSGDRPEFDFKALIDAGYEISIDPTAAQKKWVEWGLGMLVIDDLNARISQMPRSKAKADVLVGAWIYQQMGMYQSAMQQLLRNGVTLYDKERGLCTTLLPYFYPKPYWPHLEKEAEARKIDPNFALAIMREESLFNPRATSKSGAMGLMQLMPATAKGIAKSVGNKGFEVSDLYAPQTNIQFGSYYLGFLSTKFSAHPMWMAAGYNAGPNAAQRWKDRWLEMPQDVMIEQIPFAETNAYAKRVLRSFWIYSSLPL
jgi:tetratricopeptide (TPR) repeat protein